MMKTMNQDVDFEIKDSHIQGKGVFAKRKINKGETVFEWHPKVLTIKQAQELPKEELDHYTYPDGESILWMQPPERFVNHSCDANTKIVGRSDVANRDIHPGEEITSDYLDSETENFTCGCGVTNCRGKKNSELDSYILKVFTDDKGNFGDKASVVLDEGRKLSDGERIEITRKLNTNSETVFVNELVTADISIMHVQGETNFAGVAALGVAHLLSQLSGTAITTMKGRAGDIAVNQDGVITWVRAKLSSMPSWNHKQLKSPIEVERINLSDTMSWEHTMVWAWIDEPKGLIRARTFAPDWEIPESEGNGSGSMLLAKIVGKSIEIKHGKGCIIFAKLAPNGYADLGGRVVLESDTIL
jgi:predicted PhzF superfamily epimerase YddE/YHI9